MNKIILTGNLTKDPELLETSSGISYCRFSIAVNRQGTDGERVADFYNITAWRVQADLISKHFKKGNPILIEGNITLRNYEDNNGIKRQAIDINLTAFEFMGGKKDSEEEPKQAPKPKPRLEPSDDDDDSPF